MKRIISIILLLFFTITIIKAENIVGFKNGLIPILIYKDGKIESEIFLYAMYLIFLFLIYSGIKHNTKTYISSSIVILLTLLIAILVAIKIDQVYIKMFLVAIILLIGIVLSTECLTPYEYMMSEEPVIMGIITLLSAIPNILINGICGFKKSDSLSYFLFYFLFFFIGLILNLLIKRLRKK